MNFFRACTVTAGMGRQLSVCSAVVSNHCVGWLCIVISVEIGEGSSEFRDILQCFDNLKLACSERCSEVAVSGCQSVYCGAINGIGGG